MNRRFSELYFDVRFSNKEKKEKVLAREFFAMADKNLFREITRYMSRTVGLTDEMKKEIAKAKKGGAAPTQSEAAAALNLAECGPESIGQGAFDYPGIDLDHPFTPFQNSDGELWHPGFQT